MQLPFVCATCRRRLLRQITQGELPSNVFYASSYSIRGNSSRSTNSEAKRKDVTGRRWHRKPVAQDDSSVDPVNQDFMARLLGPSQDVNSRRIYSRHVRSDRDKEIREGGQHEAERIGNNLPGKSLDISQPGQRLILSQAGPFGWGALRRSAQAEKAQPSQGTSNDLAPPISRVESQLSTQNAATPDEPSRYRPNSQIIRQWTDERHLKMPAEEDDDAPILPTLDLPFRHQRQPQSQQVTEPSSSPTLFPPNPLSHLLGLDVSAFTEEIPLYKMEDEAGLQAACGIFLRKMVAAWSSGELKDASFPAPSSMLAKTRVKPLRINFFQYWEEMTWDLLHEILKRQVVAGSSHIGPSQEALLHELSRLWRLYLNQYGDKSIVPQRRGKKAESLSWANLAGSEKMDRIRRWFSKDFTARWNHFFRHTGHANQQGTDSAALLTLVILRKAATSSAATAQETLQLQDFIVRLIVNSSLSGDLDKHIAVISEQTQQSDDTKHLRESLDEICANAVTLLVEYETALKPLGNNNARMSNSDADVHRVVESFKKRIGRALADGNPNRVDALFQEAQGSSVGHSTANGRLHPFLYHHFIYAFTALKRPHRASEVWASMVSNGVHAGLPAWDALIRGCGMARDHKSVHEVWNSMMKSGIQPDSHVWATRIHALVISGHWQSAMAAFQEMTSQWIQAARASGAKGDVWELPDVQGAPKPTAHCLNSLLSGLAKGYKFDQIGEALEWAKSIGIKLDAYTFNPLLKVAALRRDSRLTQVLLRQMEAMKVQPDIATFTMMLDSIFQADEAEDLLVPSTSEQLEAPAKSKADAVSGVFRAMQMAGVKATAHTFATLISGLLKSKSPNPDAAYSILSHIKSHSLPLTGAVYTPLITHHFEQSPPDFDAVEKLWHEARAMPSMRIDVVFYDRLIEGFSKADQIGNALTALGQAGKRGKVPGWIAMHEVVSALVRAGDYERAARLVAVVRSEEQSKDKVRENRGRANFWAMVEQAGLGSHEDAQSS